MFKFRKEKTQEEPQVCGGTSTSYDENATTTIMSEDMVLFDVTSVLPYSDLQRLSDNAEPTQFVSAFAAPTDEGVFLFLETGGTPAMRGDRKRKWALVKDDIFPSLVMLVREQNLAANNGSHSFTHGLPENFGGSVNIRYASGEAISYSCNQRPVLSQDTGEQIGAIFAKAMSGEKVNLPDGDLICTIRFDEECEDGGFTHALLTVNEDGSGTLKRSRRFSGPKVYESERTVSKEDIARIKQVVADCGVLAWATLPKRSYSFGNYNTLTFAFSDGSEITVPNDRVLPEQINGGFFKIELEMTKS